MEQKLIIALAVLVIGAGAFLYMEVTDRPDEGPPAKQTRTVDRDVPQAPPVEVEGGTELVPEPVKIGSASATPVAELGPEDMLRGTVYDDRGVPVKDARIVLFQYKNRDLPAEGRIKIAFDEIERENVKSGADGTYEFTGLAAVGGNFLTLKLAADGFVTTIKDHVGGGMVVDFRLVRGSRIAGRVTDRDTKEGIGGVVVEANFKRATDSMHTYARWREVVRTDGEGQYVFPGAPQGDITVLLEHEDYEQAFYGMEQKLTVTAGDKNTFDFKMKRGIVLDGVVVDRTNDRPVDKALVTVKEMPFIPSQKHRTGVFGKFRMKGIKRGSHTFLIQAPGFTTYQENVDFNDEDMSKPVFFKLKPAGAATGTVVDQSGQPIVGAEVYVAERVTLFNKVRDFAEARTDGQGRFTVTNLDDGKIYTVAAYTQGLAIGASTDFEAISGQTIEDVIIQLEPGSKVEGRVTDDSGVALQGVAVGLEQPPFADVWFPPGLPLGQKNSRALVTDENGVFRAAGLYPGYYQLTPDHEDYIPVEPNRFQIATSNESLNFDFNLKPGHSISGRVTDSYGNPVAGASVSATEGQFSTKQVAAKTATDGTYVLKRLNERAYRVRAESPNAVAQAVDDVPSDSVGIDLVLEEYGKLVGKAVSRDGSEPVTRFSLRISPLNSIEDKQGKRDVNDRMAIKQMRTHEAYREVNVVSSLGEFSIDKIHPGEYMLEVLSDTHREGRRMGVVVTPGQEALVPPFILVEGARFEGYVRDSLGNALKGDAVRIRVSPSPNAVTRSAIGPDGKPTVVREQSNWEGKDTTLDDQGFFSVGGLPPGEVRIVMTARDYCCPPAQDRSFGASGVTREDYTLTRAASAKLTLRDENGELVGNASAQVTLPTGTRAQVDGRPVVGQGSANGELNIAKLEAGTYLVLIRRYGYEVKEVQITVREGEAYIGEVALQTLR